MSNESVIEHVEINNTDMYFSISKNQNAQKPIILYLHGGPGDSCVPLTQKFNADLEKKVIFVNLEQRGAGLSYYKFQKSEDLSMETIINDIYQFTKYLLSRFNREKIILMGHSWGSVLGLKLIQRYPELFSKYVGIGQVVNMRKNSALQQTFLKEKGLTNININLEDEQKIIKDSITLAKLVVKNGGSLYKKKHFTELIVPFIFSKSYSITDKINRIKGSNQATQYFWQELMTINFEDIHEFPIPVYFIEGRHDDHVSAKLVSDFAKNIKSFNKIIWFENSGHFPQWEEAEKFNQTIIDLCLE